MVDKYFLYCSNFLRLLVNSLNGLSSFIFNLHRLLHCSTSIHTTTIQAITSYVTTSQTTISCTTTHINTILLLLAVLLLVTLLLVMLLLVELLLIILVIVLLPLVVTLFQGSYWAIDRNPIEGQFGKKRRNPYSPEGSFSSSSSIGSPAYSLHGSAPGSQIRLHGSLPGSEMVRNRICYVAGEAAVCCVSFSQTTFVMHFTCKLNACSNYQLHNTHTKESIILLIYRYKLLIMITTAEKIILINLKIYLF